MAASSSSSSIPAMRLHSQHVKSTFTGHCVFVPLQVDAVQILPPTNASQCADSNYDIASLDIGGRDLQQDCAHHVDVKVCGRWLSLLPNKSEGVAAERAPLMLMEVKLGVEKATGKAILAVAADDSGTRLWFIVVEGSLEDSQHVLAVMGKAGAIRSDFAQQYRMLPDPLAFGTNAVVYKAVSIANDGMFAKVPDVVVKMPKEHAAGLTIQGEVKQEVTMLSLVQGHPNILKFHGLFYRREAWQDESGGEQLPCWAMVLEHCGGGDVFDLAVTSLVSEVAAGRIIKGIIWALAFVHSRQIVHRDVKPENILLKQNGEQPVLADFGIACHLSDRAEMIRKCGTPGFVAPEVLRGSRYGEKVDIFSAGSTLFFLFARKPPFAGSTLSEMLDNTMDGSVKWSQIHRLQELSVDFKMFMSMLLSKDPEERPSALEALSQPWLVMPATATESQATSSGQQMSVATQVGRQRATEGEAAMHTVDARLVNHDGCGTTEAHVVHTKTQSNSSTSLQLDSSISSSSSSQESSSGDEDELPEESEFQEESVAKPSPAFSGPATQLANDGSELPRSTRLGSLLLGHGPHVSKMMGHRARANVRQTVAPDRRASLADPSSLSARPGLEFRMQELRGADAQTPRARFRSQAQNALQRENTAGAAAPRERRASLACCQKVSALGAPETSLPASSDARPHHDDPREAGQLQRRASLAPVVGVTLHKLQQVERQTSSGAHGKTARCRRHSLPEVMMEAPKTVEASPPFIEEALRTNRGKRAAAKLRRPSHVTVPAPRHR